MLVFGNEKDKRIDKDHTKRKKCDSTYSLKDTHREKALSNKTPTLAKSMNMSIWVVGTSIQLYI